MSVLFAESEQSIITLDKGTACCAFVAYLFRRLSNKTEKIPSHFNQCFTLKTFVRSKKTTAHNEVYHLSFKDEKFIMNSCISSKLSGD